MFPHFDTPRQIFYDWCYQYTILPHGISNSTIVYVLRKAKNRFRIYLIQGQSPAVNMKHDRYGNYFTIRCKDTGTAEKIVDKAFGLGMNV